MSVVVGTAGHIDHGKTTLLRALTGIDADRLPEERRRGMTIDVGYAWMTLQDGREVDFVDVPGHDRLVGNMLVGAGEIDAALLVVAADDGPRPQTREHLELLDGLGIADGIVVITKSDLLAQGDRRRELESGIRGLLAPTSLRAAPVLFASSTTGEGLDVLRAAVAALADRLGARQGSATGSGRLAIDRAFTVRGRGLVVTGTLRGGPIRRGDPLRLVPDGRSVRVRELQVHSRAVDAAGPGRLALNLVGVGRRELRRGDVLSTGPSVVSSDRILVALRPPALDGRPAEEGERIRVHAGTAQVEGVLRGDAHASLGLAPGERAALLRLERPIAVAVGDTFVLRRAASGVAAGGGRVLDPWPPAGPARRRLRGERLQALASAGDAAAVVIALVELHGALPVWQAQAAADAFARSGAPIRSDTATHAQPWPDATRFGSLLVAPDVVAAVEAEILGLVAAAAGGEAAPGLLHAEVRASAERLLRRRCAVASPEASDAAGALLARMVEQGRLGRTRDVVHEPGRAPDRSPGFQAAMDGLEAALAVAAPPPLGEAVRATGCPPEALRALRTSGRIVELEPDLAYATSTYAQLERLALGLAAGGPLTPAAFRDATGTSRRYALAILEDLDRRGLLRRTETGHVLGPRAPGSGG